MLFNIASLTGNEQFTSKFIRIGNDIFITDFGDTKTLHINLALEHKVLERVEQLKKQNKDEVDGGFIYVTGMIIRIGGSSVTLGLPLTRKAREVTVELLQKRRPSFDIKKLDG